MTSHVILVGWAKQILAFKIVCVKKISPRLKEGERGRDEDVEVDV